MLLSGLSGKNKDIAGFIALNAVPAVILNGVRGNFEEAYSISMDYLENGKAIEKLKEVCQ